MKQHHWSNPVAVYEGVDGYKCRGCGALTLGDDAEGGVTAEQLAHVHLPEDCDEAKAVVEAGTYNAWDGEPWDEKNRGKFNWPFADDNLKEATREELEAEILKLRAGIRHHRDSSGHRLCWFVPELWSLLPDRDMKRPEVPPTAEFLEKCRLYRISLDPPPSVEDVVPVKPREDAG